MGAVASVPPTLGPPKRISSLFHKTLRHIPAEGRRLSLIIPSPTPLHPHEGGFFIFARFPSGLSPLLAPEIVLDTRKGEAYGRGQSAHWPRVSSRLALATGRGVRAKGGTT